MSRRAEGQLFIGRLSKSTRARDLEDIFEPYGRISRCEVKYGAEMAYAFVDFDDRRDAEDAVKYENGRDILGSSIIVEYAKGTPRRPVQVNRGYDECYRCHRPGHWARDCPDDRSQGYRRQQRGGGGGYGRYRSPSPRRRRRSRSRSRDRRRRSRSGSRSRSRSGSRDRRRRDRSDSRDRKRSRRRSRSQSKSKSHSRSKSKSRSPSKSRSRSKSQSPDHINGDDRQSRSRSPSE